MAAIELKDVSYRHPYTKESALKHITYTFEPGKFYGVIGENGGGKTTLCNLIRGLIPHFYKGRLKGDVLIDGKDIRDWVLSDLSAKIGYVFQNPFTQISGIKSTVFEEVALGLENLGVPKDEIISRVTTVCEQLKITDLIKNDPNELSGGQKQRVAFASILAMDMDMMIIDEPTSQLDPEGTEDVFSIIKLLKDQHKTIILVEHKIDLIAEYCEEILVMSNGRLAFSGPTHEVLGNPAIMEVGAMMPQSAVFGHAMKAAGKPLQQIPINQAEAVEFVNARKEHYGN